MPPRPFLPFEVFRFLGPRFIDLYGGGIPKCYYYEHFGNDFLAWFRTEVDHGSLAEYSNPWPQGQMRKFVEDVPDFELINSLGEPSPTLELVSSGSPPAPSSG